MTPVSLAAASCGTVSAVFLGICGLMVVGLLVQARHRAAMQEAARRLGGSYVAGGGPGNDRIEFPAGRELHVEFGPGEFTRVTFDARGQSPGVLHVFPASFGEIPASPDTRIGDAAFDGRYIVKANPEAVALRIFAPERRGRMIALVERISHLGGHRIDLSRETLEVTIGVRLAGAATIVSFVECAQELKNHILGNASGVTIVSSTAEEQATCLVCGTDLHEPAIRCLQCRTPHHLECWEYFGGCSTYACALRGGRGSDRQRTRDTLKALVLFLAIPAALLAFFGLVLDGDPIEGSWPITVAVVYGSIALMFSSGWLLSRVRVRRRDE